MRWIFLILFAWSCVAQDVVPNRRRNFQLVSTATTPQTLGANFWWVAADLTNNAHVTNWTDRIASSVFGNTASGYPSNLTDGVHFWGGSITPLTNTAAIPCTYGAVCTHFVILQFTNNISFRCYLNAGNIGGGFMTLDTSGAGNPDFTVNSGAHSGAVALSLNKWYDICYVSSNGAANAVYCYTNGALSDRFTPVSFISTNWGTMGWAAGEAFEGIIREVAVWSSAAESASVASQLHTYATNKYGYSP